MPQNSITFLDTVYLGNTVLSWLVAAGAAVVVFLAGSVARGFIVRYARRHDSPQRHGVRRLVVQLGQRLSMTVVLALAILAATYVLALPLGVERGLRLAVIVALAWQFIRWGHALVDFALDTFAGWQSPDSSAAVATSMGVLRVLLLVFLYCLVGLVAAQNMGVDVTALVAGMGIGGIAVALAVQNILGDLFASLSIVLDKPFVVGDFIIAGSQMGTVERIGVKTTRVRSLSGEQLVFANSDLLSSRIQNFKRMNERRVVFTLGIVYQTPPGVVEQVPGMIRAAIAARKGVRIDRAHFKGFGPSSLDFEAVYYVLSSDYNAYMDTQQAINLDLLREFAGRGIQFAYPTQTLFLERASTGDAPTAAGPNRP